MDLDCVRYVSEAGVVSSGDEGDAARESPTSAAHVWGTSVGVEAGLLGSITPRGGTSSGHAARPQYRKSSLVPFVPAENAAPAPGIDDGSPSFGPDDGSDFQFACAKGNFQKQSVGGLLPPEDSAERSGAAVSSAGRAASTSSTFVVAGGAEQSSGTMSMSNGAARQGTTTDEDAASSSVLLPTPGITTALTLPIPEITLDLGVVSHMAGARMSKTSTTSVLEDIVAEDESPHDHHDPAQSRFSGASVLEEEGRNVRLQADFSNAGAAGFSVGGRSRSAGSSASGRSGGELTISITTPTIPPSTLCGGGDSLGVSRRSDPLSRSDPLTSSRPGEDHPRDEAGGGTIIDELEALEGDDLQEWAQEPQVVCSQGASKVGDIDPSPQPPSENADVPASSRSVVPAERNNLGCAASGGAVAGLYLLTPTLASVSEQIGPQGSLVVKNVGKSSPPNKGACASTSTPNPASPTFGLSYGSDAEAWDFSGKLGTGPAVNASYSLYEGSVLSSSSGGINSSIETGPKRGGPPLAMRLASRASSSSSLGSGDDPTLLEKMLLSGQSTSSIDSSGAGARTSNNMVLSTLKTIPAGGNSPEAEGVDAEESVSIVEREERGHGEVVDESGLPAANATLVPLLPPLRREKGGQCPGAGQILEAGEAGEEKSVLSQTKSAELLIREEQNPVPQSTDSLFGPLLEGTHCAAAPAARPARPRRVSDVTDRSDSSTIPDVEHFSTTSPLEHRSSGGSSQGGAVHPPPPYIPPCLASSPNDVDPTSSCRWSSGHRSGTKRGIGESEGGVADSCAAETTPMRSGRRRPSDRVDVPSFSSAAGAPAPPASTSSVGGGGDGGRRISGETVKGVRPSLLVFVYGLPADLGLFLSSIELIGHREHVNFRVQFFIPHDIASAATLAHVSLGQRFCPSPSFGPATVRRDLLPPRVSACSPQDYSTVSETIRPQSHNNRRAEDHDVPTSTTSSSSDHGTIPGTKPTFLDQPHLVPARGTKHSTCSLSPGSSDPIFAYSPNNKDLSLEERFSFASFFYGSYYNRRPDLIRAGVLEADSVLICPCSGDDRASVLIKTEIESVRWE